MANESSISHLIVKQLRQELTSQEGEALEDWLSDAPANRDLLENIRQEKELLTGLKVLGEMDREAIRQKIEFFRQQERAAVRPVRIRRIMYRAMAAAAVVVICWGVYMLTSTGEKKVPVYSYNTVSVPHGKRQQVLLPDGTQVILNTGSRLKFPAAFDKGQRIVELEGEGYFVVKSDMQHPFVVRSGRQQVLVMGTTFSVRDYQDEPLQRTVLEEGKVEVQNRKGTVVLQPGQEAQADDNDEGVRVLSNSDTRDLVSWRNGYFNFDNIDIRAAIWQIAQWYNKKVVFAVDVKKGSLGSGNVQQDLPLDTLLKDLELPDLHFKVSRDTIFVTK